MWIGCYRETGKTDYRWLKTDEKVGYSNWLPGQPDRQTHELCCEMGLDSSRPDKWNDNGCGVKLSSAVCKKVGEY